ncbi:ras association domain-containing protein 8 isoform X2 [Narcine bancroftii]|uniref:ras association domain-containing protein 8 isoform X2 n=1 Tax=Narcine bancroftii TaxID=1343680 RepID=UPI003831FA28
MPESNSALMELKVWVDGVQRVVCGVTEGTSCQQVVIALAQAMGQTGRYVLVQTLRDCERQLLPNECPLQLLAKSGQSASDVCFLLRRTGSAQSEWPPSDMALPLRNITPSQPPRRREPKKSLSFTGGALDASPRHKRRPQRADAPEAGVGPPPTKDQLFRLILRQQQQLMEIAGRHASVNSEMETVEAKGSPELAHRLHELEEVVRRNEEQGEEEDYWQQELRAEKEREKELQRQLAQLRKNLQDNVQRLLGLSHRAEVLDQEVVEEGEKNRIQQAAQSAQTRSTREAIAQVRAEIEAKAQQNQQIQSSLVEVGRSLQDTERQLQAKALDLEELNKELRQCNLQQFIQQTGAAGGHPRTEEELTPEGPHHHSLQPDSTGEPDPLRDMTSRNTVGNPRMLQSPLTVNLGPDGVFV